MWVCISLESNVSYVIVDIEIPQIKRELKYANNGFYTKYLHIFERSLLHFLLKANSPLWKIPDPYFLDSISAFSMPWMKKIGYIW